MNSMCAGTTQPSFIHFTDACLSPEYITVCPVQLSQIEVDPHGIIGASSSSSVIAHLTFSGRHVSSS